MFSKPYTIELSRVARCRPDDVIERVLAPSTWPEWQSEILSTTGPQRLAAGDVVRGDAKLLGFEVQGHSTALEVRDDTFFEDVLVGVRMRVRYSVKEAPNGTVVTHRLESDMPRGVAGRVLAFLLRGRLRKMQRTLLDDLVAQCEGAS